MEAENHENNCERFVSAYGTTREEKEQEACSGCPYFASKVDPDLPKEQEEIFHAVLYKRQVLRIGGILNKQEWTSLEYAVLIMLSSAIESAELEMKRQTIALLSGRTAIK